MTRSQLKREIRFPLPAVMIPAGNREGWKGEGGFGVRFEGTCVGE